MQLTADRITAKGCVQALLGVALIPLVHMPRLIYLALLVSYAAVFNNRPNLTADPQEHLKRARRLLRRGHNSLLLYAAVELRFALERMAQDDLFISSISNRSRKQYDPVKKVKALRQAEPDSAKPHQMFLVNRKSGVVIDLGRYVPLDEDFVKRVQGRLGDLLHPKVALPLGASNAPWYVETRAFLWEVHNELRPIAHERKMFQGASGLDDTWELKRVFGAEP